MFGVMTDLVKTFFGKKDNEENNENTFSSEENVNEVVKEQYVDVICDKALMGYDKTDYLR